MKKWKGFTLIELLVVLVITGILFAIAYPSYTGVIEKTRREEAKRTLLESSQLLESYYAMNLSYSGAVTNNQLTIFTTSDDFDSFYNLTASAGTSTFTLMATPYGDQVADDCGSLTITQSGSTSASKSGCW